MVNKIRNPYAAGKGRNTTDEGTTRVRVKQNPLSEQLRKIYVPDPFIGNRGSNTQKGDINENNIRSDSMRNVVSNRIENIMDAENMEQLLPDLKLAKEILISSILSPNNLMDVKLVFDCTASDMTEIKNALLTIVEDYFTNDYKINAHLHDILEQILFTSGSYPIAVIPEAAIDEVINGSKISMESVSAVYDDMDVARSVGLLAPSDSPELTDLSNENIVARMKRLASLEQQKFNNRLHFETRLGLEELKITVTDNPNALKLAKVNTALQSSAISAALENSTGITHINGREDMVKARGSRRFDAKHIVTLKSLEDLGEKEAEGHPLIQMYPSESVVPVYVPGSPDKHIGYFIMLDRFGNPVYSGDYKDFFNQLSRSNKLTGNMSSSLLNATATATAGQPDANNELNAMEAINRYREVVESFLQGRLSNGSIGPNSKLAFHEETIRIMFARSCAQQQTQLVFVPASLMTYMALDFNKDGTGRSLLEANKIIGGIRAVILFANSMASIRNSIPRKKVGINLDETDPDPFKTVEFLMHEVARVSSSQYPVGITNPADITHSLQMSGYEVEVKNHPGFPQTELSIDDIQSNAVKPDTEFQDSMKDTMLMSLGLVPNTVDLSMEADFATSIVSSNILLAKRTLQMQQRFCIQLTDFAQALLTNSGMLRKKMVKAVNEMRTVVKPDRKKITISEKIKDEAIVDYFIKHLEVKLPEPDFSRLDMDLQAFNRFNELLEAVLPAFISSDIFNNEIMGDLGDSVDITVNILKAYYQRQFLRKNNILPELFDLIKVDDQHGAMFDLLEMHEQYGTSISKSLVNFMTKMLLRTEKTNQIVQQLHDRSETEAGSSSDSSSDDSGSEGNEGGEGGDDFDLGGDFGEGDGTGEPTDGGEGGEEGGTGETGEDKPDEEAASE